jgi:predicted permease
VLVLKPLPFRDPDSLGWILATAPGSSVDRAGVSLPEYAAFRDGVSALTHLAAWRRQPVALRERDRSERALAQQVIGDLQGLWGVHLTRGRLLSRSDERPGAPRVVVLSHRFWMNRFGGSETLVGAELQVDGEPHNVVGVLDPTIELGNVAEVDVWLPYRSDPVNASRVERGWRPVGRLVPGATIDDANVQVAAIAQRLAHEHPEETRDWTARASGTRDALAGTNTWLVLSMLAVVVALLLLLACANIMNLLIARLIGRRQELAVRIALGATRGQVVRQIVSESVLLGLVGGAVGLAAAWAGLQAIHAVAVEPFFQQIAFDWRVLLFAVLLAFIAPLGFSIVPTLRVLGDDVRATLSEGSGRSVGSAAAARGRSGLVVLQVALAVTLLVVSALVVQSMQAVVSADPGYDPSKLLTTQIDVAPWAVADDAAALRLRQRLLARVADIPGVQKAALSTVLPALQFAPQVAFDIVGQPYSESSGRPRGGLTVVTPDYFTVFAIPVLAGRAFEQADSASPHAVAIVSAEAARRYWGGLSEAAGAVIRLERDNGAVLEATVIGVVRNTGDPDLAAVPTPGLFLLDAHRPSRTTHIVLRADRPVDLADAVRQAVAEVDPNLPLSQLRTVSAAFADEQSSNHLLSGMFASFALVAILLAMAGLYGVMSYAVSQRSKEIALRLALGASSREIAGQVVGQSLRLAALGAVIGVVGAYGLAHAVRTIFYGVTATDPTTYVAAVGLTLVAAFVASWLPMRRAATIDPIDSLRQS